MTIELTLREHERSELTMPADTARGLARAAAGRLAVGVGTDPDSFQIIATDHVGTLVAPGVKVLVRPKIPLHNLFALLDVGLPPDAWDAEVFAFGADRDVLPAFASFFSRVAERALARGLHRDYMSHEDRLVVLRGRLNFPELLRRPDVATPLPCRYDEYTPDVAENQVLLAALQRFRTVAGVPVAARRRMLRLEARLEGVNAVTMSPADVDRIVLTRLNIHYQPALTLARLVLAGSSLLDRSGQFVASSFMLSMNELFERFITARLVRLLEGVAVRPQDPGWLDRNRTIKMIPDVVFAQADEPVYVADIKYKITSTGLARSQDSYQLFAYTTGFGVPEGVLIYCQCEGELPPREVEVVASGKRLLTYPLELSGRPLDVERAVRGLAKWIQSRIEAIQDRAAEQPDRPRRPVLVQQVP